MRAIHFGLLALCLLSDQARADDVTVEITGSPSIVFDSAHDGCTPDDMPDVNPRAYRDADDRIVMFALYDINRPLRGPDFGHLKIDCHVALGSPNDANPARYDDRNFITALWTSDGRHVSALVHHEYHADDHGTCKAKDSLGCWYNTILNYRSDDGGADFHKAAPLVVAAAPFRQDVEQGRHRGFFNPSNIFAGGGYYYASISTTGWDGQPFGSCLFRTKDPLDRDGWRAYDGTGYNVRYADPYKSRATTSKPCFTIKPLDFAVGSVVRHRASGHWIAVFQASEGDAFPVDGFYYATSRDLLRWSEPRILLAGKTLYNDLCKAGSQIIAYPAMLDPASKRRNFDEVGDHPDLFLTTMQVENCQTGVRLLVREQLTIRQSPKS